MCVFIYKVNTTKVRNITASETHDLSATTDIKTVLEHLYR